MKPEGANGGGSTLTKSQRWGSHEWELCFEIKDSATLLYHFTCEDTRRSHHSIILACSSQHSGSRTVRSLDCGGSVRNFNLTTPGYTRGQLQLWAPTEQLPSEDQQLRSSELDILSKNKKSSSFPSSPFHYFSWHPLDVWDLFHVLKNLHNVKIITF